MRTWGIGGLVLVLASGSGIVSAAAQPTIKIGGTCDRTGSVRLIGSEFCPGVADYIALVNRKGGLQGHRLEYREIDHAYMVDRAVAGYEQLKRDGVVTVSNIGVPMLEALTPRFMADRIPVFNTGTGIGEAIDGERWPYIFPGTASYWTQAGTAMAHLKSQGARRGTKVAFLYFDNPAGRQGLPMIEAVAAREGYVLRRFPVRPPGVEMTSEVVDIARQFGADWVVASLFGKSPAVAIREFRKAGFPLDRVLSFVWGAGDADVAAAGWDEAQGYLGLQWAALGRSHPVIQEIITMFREQKRAVPAHVGSAYYNRGVTHGALVIEGIRLAIQHHGLPLTGEKVRRGYEAIAGFDLQGMLLPITLTPRDHEGGGHLKVYQVRGKTWVPVTGWIRGYREDVMALVRQANRK